jgi:ATP-binding cassette, subfamily B, bacterial PglK
VINIKKEILNLIRIYDLSRNDINTIFFTLLSITIIELLGLGVIVVALNYISSQEVFIFNVEVSNVEKIIYSLTFLLLLFIGKLFILRKLFKTQMSQVYSIYKRTFHNAISKYFTSDYMITKTYKEDNIKKILTIELLLGTYSIYSFVSFLTSLITIIVIVLFSIFYNGYLSIIIFSSLFIMYYPFINYIKNKNLDYGKRREETQSILFEETSDSISAFREIILNNISTKFINTIDSNNEKFVDAVVNSKIVSFLPKYYIEILIVLFLLFYSLASFILEIPSDKMIEVLIVYLTILYKISATAGTLTASFTDFIFYKASNDKVLDFLNLITSNQKLYKANNDKEFKKIEFKKIEFKNVNFKYDKNDIFVNNINLDINESDHIMIVGKSGSGKSTFVDLISGLISPSNGEIIYNKKNEKISISNIAYMSQHSFIFNDSVKNNVVLFEQHYDNNLLNEAIKYSMFSIPNYYNEVNEFICGDNGNNLSGGQKQRLAIARVIYYIMKNNINLIILDEMTSALDSRTEKQVMENIMKVCSDKTLVFITHNDSLSEYFNYKINFSSDAIIIKEEV